MTVRELLDRCQGYDAPRPVAVAGAVTRFLATLPAACTAPQARERYVDDAALYGWNAATQRAVRLALRARFGAW